MRSVMVSTDRIAVLILAAVAVIAGITFQTCDRNEGRRQR